MTWAVSSTHVLVLHRDCFNTKFCLSSSSCTSWVLCLCHQCDLGMCLPNVPAAGRVHPEQVTFLTGSC